MKTQTHKALGQESEEKTHITGNNSGLIKKIASIPVGAAIIGASLSCSTSEYDEILSNPQLVRNNKIFVDAEKKALNKYSTVVDALFENDTISSEKLLDFFDVVNESKIHSSNSYSIKDFKTNVGDKLYSPLLDLINKDVEMYAVQELNGVHTELIKIDLDDDQTVKTFLEDHKVSGPGIEKILQSFQAGNPKHLTELQNKKEKDKHYFCLKSIQELESIIKDKISDYLNIPTITVFNKDGTKQQKPLGNFELGNAYITLGLSKEISKSDLKNSLGGSYNEIQEYLNSLKSVSEPQKVEDIKEGTGSEAQTQPTNDVTLAATERQDKENQTENMDIYKSFRTSDEVTNLYTKLDGFYLTVFSDLDGNIFLNTAEALELSNKLNEFKKMYNGLSDEAKNDVNVKKLYNLIVSATDDSTKSDEANHTLNEEDVNSFLEHMKSYKSE